jgi:hypothetical protein
MIRHITHIYIYMYNVSEDISTYKFYTCGSADVETLLIAGLSHMREF